jgi:hypothetical protein
MEKLKTTKKQIERNYRIASIGYCEAQYLLKYKSPFAYSAGVYGWNADYYDVGGVIIATGYRSLPNSKNTKCDYKTVRAFDERASKAKTAQENEAILQEFIKAISVN